jgi:hypothetical protein
VTQVVECLLSKHEDLTSSPSTIKNERERGERERERERERVLKNWLL